MRSSLVGLWQVLTLKSGSTSVLWEHDHLHLVGHYSFDISQQYSLDNLRPLRSASEIEIADEDDVEAYMALSGLY